MHFLDTNILVGATDRNDELHEIGKRIIEEAATGRLGTSIVSDFVLDEALTILSSRRGVGPKLAVRFATSLLESPRVRCVYVDSGLFKDSLDVLSRFGPKLSFTDASIVAVLQRLGCKSLFSNDDGFDRVPGIVRSITP